MNRAFPDGRTHASAIFLQCCACLCSMYSLLLILYHNSYRGRLCVNTPSLCLPSLGIHCDFIFHIHHRKDKTITSPHVYITLFLFFFDLFVCVGRGTALEFCDAISQRSGGNSRKSPGLLMVPNQAENWENSRKMMREPWCLQSLLLQRRDALWSSVVWS